jgi:DNA-binding GntR family transcriptional regulator
MSENDEPENGKEAENIILRMVLSERIKDFITESILSGVYKPGDRIVESALARRLGVSQAPVREAIRDLVLLGFLETEPYKGTSVRMFSAEELNEVYMVRAALESLAARLAATKVTEADLGELQSILDEMIEAGRENDTLRMTKLDNDFHGLIMEISGNKLLAQLWQTLRFGLWTIITTRITTYDLLMLAERHRELMKALQSRDPELAMRTMQHHIEDLGRPPEALEQEVLNT